jgi:hypothetical protein
MVAELDWALENFDQSPKSDHFQIGIHVVDPALHSATDMPKPK